MEGLKRAKGVGDAEADEYAAGVGGQGFLAPLSRVLVKVLAPVVKCDCGHSCTRLAPASKVLVPMVKQGVIAQRSLCLWSNPARTLKP